MPYKNKLEIMRDNFLVQIELLNNEIILIEAGKKGLEILNSTFEEVLKGITGGFHARIGAEREEVQELLLLIKIPLETFDSQPIQNSTMKVQISVEQLRIFTQILSEACHGIKILDFENKIGTTKNQLKSFLDVSINLYESIEKSI
ncbi:hypothetical protein [Okeania sp. KiyG1]|uniref:hypothetical protein n=1 Tax=Okeania sp. KiyG1 TaxID=2720165 RepID=UPI001986814C|nr:hypothetical protein [Okeania sp. KiyG1]GGA40547.1 hypothetical protein CYANOKiyG1_58840 [Okeania sp. KiyG1]